jgi:hypothetical protein
MGQPAAVLMRISTSVGMCVHMQGTGAPPSHSNGVLLKPFPKFTSADLVCAFRTPGAGQLKTPVVSIGARLTERDTIAPLLARHSPAKVMYDVQSIWTAAGAGMAEPAPDATITGSFKL